MQVLLGLNTYPITLDPELESLGETTMKNGKASISIRKLEDWEDYQTLFHEVLHLIDWEYGLKLGEHRVRTLEKMLPMMMIQNPWLVKGVIAHAVGTRGDAEGSAQGSSGQEGASGFEEPGEGDGGSGSSA